MISQFKYLLSKIVEIESRLRALEKFNQVRNLLVKGNLTITEGGVLTIKNSSGDTIFEFNPTTQKLDIYDSSGNIIIEFDTTNQTATIGGDSNVKIDGANKRIIISDGTNDRVLIGYQSGGF